MLKTFIYNSLERAMPKIINVNEFYTKQLNRETKRQIEKILNVLFITTY